MTAMPPPASPRNTDSESFIARLRQQPVVFTVIAAAKAGALGLFAPEILVPEPLQMLRPLGTLLVLVAFLLAWSWRKWLHAHAKAMMLATFLLMVLFAGLRLRFVRAVDYIAPTRETRYVLVGPTITDPDLMGMTDEDAVKTVGGSWSALRNVWGGGFEAAALSYSLTYLLLIQAVIMSLGATQIGGSRH
jgi:hypothetical protein